MKTIIVPTDFSNCSNIAAKYAFSISAQLQSTKVVLYNAFQSPPIITEPSMPAVSYIDMETLREIGESGIKHFKDAVKSDCPNTVLLESKVEFASLTDEIDNVCESTGAELIVMGITGTSKLEEVLIGSTALTVMRNTKIPVIIVPVDNLCTSIKNVLLMTDLKKVVETTPIENINKILVATKANLHVVNLYENEKEITEEKNLQQELLGSMLKSFNPTFHMLHCEHFIDGVNDFVRANNIDLIIAIPKKHGFFSDFFKESHTKKLAYHTHVPLIYIHNEDL